CGLFTTSSASAVTCAASPTTALARATSLSATMVMRISQPARREISSLLRWSTLKVPLPTVPMPSNPTLIGFIAFLFSFPVARPVFRSRQQPILAEHLLDGPDRLPGPRLVFDQCETDVIVAVMPESGAGGN